MVVWRYSFIISISFLLFTSCSKEEPDTAFEGTWLLQASEKRNCNDSDKNSKKTDDFVFDSPCSSEARFLCSYELYIFSGSKFNRSSSTTFFAIPFSSNDEGNYTISGSTLTICKDSSSGEQQCEVIDYAINGNTMTLSSKNPDTGCLEIDYYLKR